MYTFSDPAPNGAVTMSFSMVGPRMNLFRKYRCFRVCVRARAHTLSTALCVHSTLVETSKPRPQNRLNASFTCNNVTFKFVTFGNAIVYQKLRKSCEYAVEHDEKIHYGKRRSHLQRCPSGLGCSSRACAKSASGRHDVPGIWIHSRRPSCPAAAVVAPLSPTGINRLSTTVNERYNNSMY